MIPIFWSLKHFPVGVSYQQCLPGLFLVTFEVNISRLIFLFSRIDRCRSNQFFTIQVSNMATRRQQRRKCCFANQNNQSLGEVTSFFPLFEEIIKYIHCHIIQQKPKITKQRTVQCVYLRSIFHTWMWLAYGVVGNV